MPHQRNRFPKRIINGSWQYAGGHGRVTQAEALKTFRYAVEQGLNYFDTADIYTGVEELLGTFIRRNKKIADRIHVHTKFVPDKDVLPVVDRRYVEKAIDRSLKRLHKDRIDLVQFHWWNYRVDRFVEVAGYLDGLRRKGKIRRIGVTNFDVSHLKKILDAGISVVSNQVQFSLLDHRPEHGMTRFAKRNDIDLLCYGTLAGGYFSEQFLGNRKPTNPPNRSLVKYGLIINEFGGWPLYQKLLRVLNDIATKHRVSIANVAAKYVLEQESVTAVIIAARAKEHIHENVKVPRLKLDREDHDLIGNVLKRSKWRDGEIYDRERDPRSRHYRIMKYNLSQV